MRECKLESRVDSVHNAKQSSALTEDDKLDSRGGIRLTSHFPSSAAALEGFLRNR